MRIKDSSALLKNISVILYFVLILVTFFPIKIQLVKISILLNVALIAYQFMLSQGSLKSFKLFSVNQFFIIYVFYSMASLFWAQSFDFGIKHVNMILVHASLFYLVMYNLHEDFSEQKKYTNLLVVVFIIYNLVCIWEMASFSHLPTSRHFDSILPNPTGLFYGENIQAMVTSFITPIICYKYAVSKNNFFKLLFLIALLVSFIIIIVQGARIALIALVPLYAYTFIKYSNWRVISIAIAIIIALIYSLSLKYPKQFELAEKYCVGLYTSVSSETETYNIGSTQIRINMVKRAINLCRDSHFIGVGAGNFDYHTKKGFFGDTDWIENPHSYLFELVANFGLFVVIPFLIFIAVLIIRLFLIMIYSKGRLKVLSEFNLISVFVFLVVSNLPSSMFNIFVMWIHIAYLTSFAFSFNVRNLLISQQKICFEDVN